MNKTHTDAQKCCKELHTGLAMICGCPCHTTDEWEESLWVEVMEDYVITAELGHIAKDQKKHKEEMRAHFANLKSFIHTEIANARREEREMIRNKIKNLIIADDTWAKETKKAILGWCFPAELNQALTNKES